MESVIEKFEKTYQKPQTPNVQSGDTVRVHQRIVEGNKVRTQAFEGVVIRTKRMNSLTAAITVRRISSGVGVEKTFKLHAPNVEKVEVLRRSKVRRNYLSFLRQRQGKAARLQEISFDRSKAEVDDTTPIVEEAEEEAPTTPAEEQEEKSTEENAQASEEEESENTEDASTEADDTQSKDDSGSSAQTSKSKP